MDVIKILLILLITFLLLFPMMPFAARTKKVSTIHALKYTEPHNRKNGWFILLALIEILLFLGLVSVITSLVDSILAIDFIAKLISKAAQGTSANFDFVFFVIFAVVLNAIVIYLYAILKALLKKCILDPAFGFSKKDKKKKNKRKKGEEEPTDGDIPETPVSEEERRIPNKSYT